MRNIFAYTIIIATLIFFVCGGCENDIEKVTRLTEGSKHPRIIGTNIEVIFSDSAKVKAQIQAPEFRQFQDVEKPYMEFPKGIEVYFYNDSLKIESKLRADYTIYYNEEKLWHATGDVQAVNLDNGDRLNTEELFWDEEKELIYSNTFTRIQNQDGTWYGKNGFESHRNLNNWKLKGSSGTVNVRDEN